MEGSNSCVELHGGPSTLVPFPLPLFTGLHCGSGAFQFLLALLTSCKAIWNYDPHMEWKRRTRKESTGQKKFIVAWPIEETNKTKICSRTVSWTFSTHTARYPLKNHIEYSTSHFVLLHLNCKKESMGFGWEQRITLPAMNDWLQIPTQNQRSVKIMIYVVVEATDVCDR